MAFNPENRITWEELAPSLQELFKNLQSQITREVERAKQVEEEIKDAIETLTFGMFNGGKGQVLKIDIPGMSAKPDDNFHVMRMVSDGLGTTVTKQVPPISLKEVFNTWDRHYIYYGILDNPAFPAQDGGNPPTPAGGLNQAWTYNASNLSIANNGNWSAYCFFLSHQTYDNYDITVRMRQLAGKWEDDDMVGLIVGAYKDPATGFIHTLLACIWGCNDGTNPGSSPAGDYGPLYKQRPKLGLIYDYQSGANWINPEVNTLAYDNTCKGQAYGTRSTYLRVVREGSKIMLSRTEVGGSINNMVSNLTWELPMTKPAAWPDDMWTNINKMLTEPSPMGFATLSNDCYFQIVNQKDIFVNETIYDVLNGKKYVYVDGVWVETTLDEDSDEIPWRCWIWNRITGELFWYLRPGTYYKVHSDLEIRKTIYGFPVGNGELEEALRNWDGAGGNLDTYLEAQGIVPDDNTKKLLDRIIALGG